MTNKTASNPVQAFETALLVESVAQRFAAAPAGKAQKAIMDYLGDNDSAVELTDMVRTPAFRGVHLQDVMSAAEALKKKGLIEYNTSVGSSTLKKKASVRTASIWNSSWHKVSVFSDGWAHEITVRREVSPTGLTDDTSDKICKDLKSDAIKGVDELLGKLKIKPAKIKPDAHVFLEGKGTEVLYSFLIGVYAKDDKQSAQLVEAFSHVVRK